MWDAAMDAVTTCSLCEFGFPGVNSVVLGTCSAPVDDGRGNAVRAAVLEGIHKTRHITRPGPLSPTTPSPSYFLFLSIPRRSSRRR